MGPRLVGFFVASGSTADPMVDIYYVCKSPTAPEKGVFEELLRHFIPQVTHPQASIVLSVATNNARNNTEMGRLLLYTSLGFRIVPGQKLTLVWDEWKVAQSGLTVVNHSLPSIVEVKTENANATLFVHVGILRAGPIPIVMELKLTPDIRARPTLYDPLDIQTALRSGSVY